MRERVFDAARELMAREGPAALSMRSLAAKIGYSPAALYFHFPDRERLLAELVHHDFQRFRRTFDRLEKIADPLERLARMGRAYVEFGLRHPAHYRIMFMTPVGDPPEEDLEKLGRGNPCEDAYALLRSVVADVIAAGLLRPEYADPELVSQAILSALHGVVSMYLTHARDPWIEWRPVRHRARTVGESLLRGMLRRPAMLDGVSAKVAADGPVAPDETFEAWRAAGLAVPPAGAMSAEAIPMSPDASGPGPTTGGGASPAGWIPDFVPPGEAEGRCEDLSSGAEARFAESDSGDRANAGVGPTTDEAMPDTMSRTPHPVKRRTVPRSGRKPGREP